MYVIQNIINERGWLVGSPHYGIPHKYITEFCLQCSLCSARKRPNTIKRKKYHYDEVIHVPIENGLVIYFQAYDPNNEVLEKRHFVLVIQSDWMRGLAIQITPNSAWAIDNTFKTNQYELLLYAAMCPNNRGYGIHIFLMLCSKDYQEGHEATTLKLTLWAVFERMGPIRPNAIVIDKNAIELNAFTTVINNDPWCWANNVIGGEQIKCKLLLC